MISCRKPSAAVADSEQRITADTVPRPILRADGIDWADTYCRSSALQTVLNVSDTAAPATSAVFCLAVEHARRTA